MLLEDTDFQYLFEADMDGIEDDPASQAAMGIEVSDVTAWSSPFNQDSIVHPYAETQLLDRPEVHNLLGRIDNHDEQRALFASKAINAADPIAGLGAARAVVTLARRAAADDANVTAWIPNESDPESSFADLRTKATAGRGSGWITWERYDGADIVRTDPVVSFTSYRHFPVGDCPWVWAAVERGRLLAIPLSVMVSYQPDPEVVTVGTTRCHRRPSDPSRCRQRC